MFEKTFKDIYVFDTLTKFIKHQKSVRNLVYMIQCISGKAQLIYNGKEYTFIKDDMLFSSADRMPKLLSQTKEFRCKIFATDARALTDAVFTCMRDEPGWLDKMRFLLKHPIIHISHNKVKLIQAYRDLVHFYTEEEGFYKKRVAYLQVQAIVFEMLSWVDEAMH